jgi:cytochrome c oxidase subunit 2
VSDVIRRLRANAPRLVPALLLLALVALLLSGCETDTPQNTFAAEGEVARKQRDIFYYSMWPAIGVMILVLGGILVMCLRFRERDPKALPPKQIEGNTRLELTWTIVPAIALLILGVPMVAMIYDIGAEPGPDAYFIDVQAQRYSFAFEYPDIVDNDGNPLFVPAEPHMPAGRQVAFRLHSSDVIHSFWIPRLGGKLDVVPNDDNVLWLKADKPDTFFGQCVEFCGLEHAKMGLIIHVDSEEDFEIWKNEQQAKLDATPAPRPSGTPATTPTATPEAGG